MRSERQSHLRGVVALLAFVGCAAAAQDLAGRVAKVSDGDTLTLDTGRQKVVVRLQDIDAPEGRQAFGQESSALLRALCPPGSLASGKVKERDRFGRLVAMLRCGEKDASTEQVRAGAAWVFVRYAPKDSPLYQIEADARAARRGLWSDPRPTPPWGFRRGTVSRTTQQLLTH